MLTTGIQKYCCRSCQLKFIIKFYPCILSRGNFKLHAKIASVKSQLNFIFITRALIKFIHSSQYFLNGKIFHINSISAIFQRLIASCEFSRTIPYTFYICHVFLRHKCDAHTQQHMNEKKILIIQIRKGMKITRK